MKKLALWAIGFYQRVISPRKGFSCAYRLHTGRAGCSALGYRAIARFGLWRGLGVLRKRLKKCGEAYRSHAPRHGPLHAQAGVCDCACDLPGDLPSCNGNAVSTGCDVASNCASGCDCGNLWPSRKKNEDA